MKATVLYNQSILDLALQHTGSVENCFSIAVANGFSVSDPISTGLSAEIPGTLPVSTDVLTTYSAKKIQPSTGESAQENEIPILKGIGFMRIGNSFKIS